jgi:hypothetical protein
VATVCGNAVVHCWKVVYFHWIGASRFFRSQDLSNNLNVLLLFLNFSILKICCSDSRLGDVSFLAYKRREIFCKLSRARFFPPAHSIGDGYELWPIII